MEDLIPLTDFDQRNFPEISEDEKIDFVVHSNNFERINTTADQVKSAVLFPQKADPAIAGQMRCIGLIEQLAKNPNLIPKPDRISAATFDSEFPWFARLHKNLMHDFAKKGEELMNQFDYPLAHEVGSYRSEEKLLAHRKMPSPLEIKTLLAQAFRHYCEIYYNYKQGIENPRLLEKQDWQKLEDAAYKLNLAICCIKPFKDGSNRVARMTENLLRLNTGQKFRILADKDKLLRDIWTCQDLNYRAVD